MEVRQTDCEMRQIRLVLPSCVWYVDAMMLAFLQAACLSSKFACSSESVVEVVKGVLATRAQFSGSGEKVECC